MSARFDQEWMPFFGNWFWNSKRVAKLDDSEALLYQWLIWYQWENEHLDEPAVMRQIAPGRFARKWSKLWPAVEHLFNRCDDGLLRNLTCAEQRAIANTRREAGRKRASNGARATNERRWMDRSSDRSSDAQAIAQATPERPVSDRSSDPQAIAQASLADRTGPDRTGPDRTGQVPHPNPPHRGGRDPALTETPPAKPKRARKARIDPASYPLPAEIDTPDVRSALVDYNRTRKGGAWDEALAEVRVRQLAEWGRERAVAALRCSVGYQGLFEPGGTAHALARAPHGSNIFADELARRNGSAAPTIDVPVVRVGGAA